MWQKTFPLSQKQYSKDSFKLIFNIIYPSIIECNKSLPKNNNVTLFHLILL